MSKISLQVGSNKIAAPPFSVVFTADVVSFPSVENNNHGVHPWVQSPQLGEQYVPSTIPSYVSYITLPSISFIQDRVVNYNHESKICGQQTNAGIFDGSCQLTIPIELLSQRTILEAPPGVKLKEIILLGPDQSSIELFLNSRDFFMTSAIHALERVPFLEKITFSLDFRDLLGILKTLARIPGMREVELTLPTASKPKPHSFDMQCIQQAFVNGLTYFRHLKRLTMPMEFVTALALSYLADLPNLESLSIKYSPPPRAPHYQQVLPAWSSYKNPAECPGYIFIAHLNFDPRGHFKQLLRLDLGAPLSESSNATLKTLFPKTHIC